MKNTLEDLIRVIKDGRFRQVIEDLQFEVATATSTPDEIVEAEHDIFMVLEYINIHQKIVKELEKAGINNDNTDVYPMKICKNVNKRDKRISVKFTPKYLEIYVPSGFSTSQSEFVDELNELLRDYSELLNKYRKNIKNNRLNKIVSRALEI